MIASELFVDVPSWNTFDILSRPDLSFSTETRKSTVLLSTGFHLKDISQVDFSNGPASPFLFDATPVFDGVNISPSVMYSTNPSLTDDMISEHPSNMVV